MNDEPYQVDPGELRVVGGQPDGSVKLSNGSSLTSRELEVLTQIALGGSNPEIAGALFLSVHTVEFHATRIYQKLGVRNRFQASLAAKSLSLLDEAAPEARTSTTSRAVRDAWPEEAEVASVREGGVKLTPLRLIVASVLALVAVFAIMLLAGLMVGHQASGVGGGSRATPVSGLESMDAAAMAPEALRRAREPAPDAVLVRVVVDPVAGSTVFSFVSPDASTQVDVLVPRLGASPDDWEVTRGSPGIEEPMLGKELDLDALAIDARFAFEAVTAEFDCTPTSLTLAPLGNEPGERQTWLVACDFADGRRVLGLVDARTGKLEVPGAPMDPARVRALAGGPQPVDGPSIQPLDTAPDWSRAAFVDRDGRILTLRLTASGEMIDVDLSQVGVFDCRVECYVNIGSRLGGLSAEDDICIGWLGIRDGHQDGMLWVDRYTCAEGGRVIPP